MAFKLKSKPTYFGLEFDHDVIPNAIVLPSRRGQKIIEWVKSYEPITYERADGKKVRRERTAVVTPLGFRLRKDEILGAMKRNKLTSYQDGKFYVVLDHRMGEFEHPTTSKMKKEKAAKEVKTDGQLRAAKSDQPEPVGVGVDITPVVSEPGRPDSNLEPVESLTDGGLKVTDRRRSAGDTDSKESIL